MDKLIKAIQVLDESAVKIDLDGYFDATHPLVKDVALLADQLLITSTGKLDIDNMEVLDSKGYQTFPIEKDRFGWLIGGIQTSFGIVTYG
jgi:hypothetical protein